MKSPIILRFDVSREYYFAEGCYILELSNSVHDPELSVARVRVDPGATTRWHFLRGTAERYVILTGSGRVEIGDMAPRNLIAGDFCQIPAGCHQRITNTGADDLVFLALCTPRFLPEAYQDCES